MLTIEKANIIGQGKKCETELAQWGYKGYLEYCKRRVPGFSLVA